MFSEISAGRRDLRRARSFAPSSALRAAALAFSLCLAGGPAAAQDQDPPGGGGFFGGEGFGEEYLDDEAEQAIRDFLAMVGPALRQLETLFQDLPAYEPPEMLPNGDIIIRRRRGWGEGPSDDAPEKKDEGDGDGGNGWTKT